MSVDLIARSLAQAATPVAATAAAIPSLRLATSVGVIQTSGYDTAGSGAGLYVSDSLATLALAAAHPRFCKADGSSPTRYWRLAADTVNVRQGGARGDGVTDDTAAIQAAIAYVTALGGGRLFVPGGIYAVTQIVPASDQTLFGEGAASKIQGGAGSGMVVFNSTNNSWVEDLWLHSTVSGYAAVTTFHTQITGGGVRRCKITTAAGLDNNAILLVFNNPGSSCDNFALDDNLIVSPGRMGIEVLNQVSGDPLRVQNLSVCRNRISGSGATAGSYGMAISISASARAITVDHNEISDPKGVGIEWVGPTYSSMSGNKITGGQDAAIGLSGALLMAGNVIAGNVVRAGAASLGMFLRSLAKSAITDNVFDLSASAGIVTIGGEAVGHGSNLITGNVIYTNNVNALVNDATPNNHYADNLLDNSASSGNFAALRFYAAASTACTATKNRIKKGAGGAWVDEAGGAAGNKLFDNIWDAGGGFFSLINGSTKAAAVANLTTTATAGSLPTPDGAVTIANAATPTVVELLEYCVELETRLEGLLDSLRTSEHLAP